MSVTDTTMIVLDDEHLENVQREMLKAASESLKIASDTLAELAQVAPWPAAALATTAISTVETAQRDLGTLELVGWPENDRVTA